MSVNFTDIKILHANIEWCNYILTFGKCKLGEFLKKEIFTLQIKLKMISPGSDSVNHIKPHILK
jgi:hypothetical protein